MAHCSILAQRIPGTERPAGCRVGQTEWPTLSLFTVIRGPEIGSISSKRFLCTLPQPLALPHTPTLPASPFVGILGRVWRWMRTLRLWRQDNCLCTDPWVWEICSSLQLTETAAFSCNLCRPFRFRSVIVTWPREQPHKERKSASGQDAVLQPYNHNCACVPFDSGWKALSDWKNGPVPRGKVNFV